MTVLSAVQQAAPWVGIAVPSTLFTATDRTAVDMQAMTNEAAKAIAECFDWQRLRATHTITGDGTTEDWELPADYARMIKDARLWPSDQPNCPLEHVVDTDRWLGLEVQAFDTVIGRWTIFGNEVHIKPAIASGATVRFFYVSNKIVVAEGGTAPTKTGFDADDDTLFVDDRLLKLAIIWRWKASHGRPYGEDMANFQNALDVMVGTDKGARILTLGPGRRSRDADVAYPQALG